MAPSQQQDSFIDDSDEFCPLCVEEFDLSDKNFKPCPCGYQICQFCFNNIRKNLNGLCPACRREYSDETIEFKTVSQAEFRADLQKQSKKKAELKQKEQQKREQEAINRKHLSGLRVVQKNLVYVTGLNPGIREENLLQTLRGQDYFGQYGRIIKIVVNKRTGEKSGSHTIDLSGKSSGGGGGGGIGVYVTFQRKEDAESCIAAVDGSVNGDRVLRATYGTTKYCSAYLRNEQCSNKNCMFLHEPGEDADSFTRQDLSSFNVKSSQRGSSSNAGPPPQHPPVAAAVQPTISRQASGYQGGAGIKPPRTPATVENSPAMGSSALPATVNWATKGPGTPVGGRPASIAAQSPRSVSEKVSKTVHERENNSKTANNSASPADHPSKGSTNGNKQAATTSPPPIQTKQPKKSQTPAPPPPTEPEKKTEASPKQPSPPPAQASTPAQAPAQASTPAPAPAPITALAPAPAPAPASVSVEDTAPVDPQPAKEPAKNSTPAPTSAPPADPTAESMNDLTGRLVECLKCITSPKFRFVFDKSMLSEEEFKEIQNMPPLFDKFGGAKRRERIAKEREREIEEEKLRLQQQAQAQQQAQQQANQPPQSAPLPAQQSQLQSAQQQPPQPPASAHGLPRQLPQQMSSFLMHQQAQPQQQHQAGRAQTPGSAIPPGQFNIFGGPQQQAQQTMQTQMPQQSQHTRQHSRYNFANEGPNVGLKPTAASNQQQQHLNQQQQLLPQQQSLLQAQLYGFGSGNSSVQAPPPGLKSAPTPPTLMGMYSQQGGLGLNLANAGQQQPGASHLGHNKSDSQDLLHLMRTGNVKQLGDPSILQARLGPQQHPMQHQLNGLIGQGQQGGFASVYYGSSNRW